MSESLKIVVLVGTVRAERMTERALKFVERELNEKFAIHEVSVIDVRNLTMPMDDDGPILGDANPEYHQAVKDMDALVIIAPEYNHSFPGTLKRALDMLKIPDCMHKAVGVVGVSNGMFGGGRMAESLLPVVRTLGLVSIKLDHYFPRIQDTLSEEGVSNDSATIEAFERFMQELLWMAGTLKVAREQGTK